MLWLIALLLLLPLALTSPHLAPVIAPVQNIARFWYGYIAASLRKNLLISFFTYYINKLSCSKKCRAKLLKSFYKSYWGKTLTKSIPNMFSNLIPKSVRVWVTKFSATLIGYLPKDIQKTLTSGGWFFYFALFCHIRIFIQLVSFLWGLWKSYQERRARNEYIKYKRSRAHASAYEAAQATGGTRHHEPEQYDPRQERYALNPKPGETRPADPTPIKYETEVRRSHEQRAAPVPKPIRIQDPIPLPNSAPLATPLRTPAFAPTPTTLPTLPTPDPTPTSAPKPRGRPRRTPAPDQEQEPTPLPKPRGRPRLTPTPIQSIEQDPEWGGASTTTKKAAPAQKKAAAPATGKRPRGRPRKNPV
ncbi:hypothetical protein BDV18DRAFT_161001 [Aspergillus unguis]